MLSPKTALVIKIIGGTLALFFFCALLVFIYYANDLPRPEVFTEKPFVLPAEIYDRNGETLLYQIYGEEKRTIVSLDQVPDHFKKAALAAEDSNFYNHPGIDLKGILRSILKNIQIGKPVYGGSTISQQLIRSSFLTLDKTIQRKAKEIILTLELERRYSKDQILEFYLNQIPFGFNAYGVGAASKTYFNKPVQELTLEESAILAALIRGPSRLSPEGPNHQELMDVKDFILERMASLGYISKEESKEAQEKEIVFADIRHQILAPHFVLYVKNYLENKYSDYFLREKGLRIYTTLDWDLQQLAEEAVQERIEINKSFNSHNAGLVAMDPNTGGILAMVGSADYWGQLYPEGCEPGLNCFFEPKVNVTVYGGGRQPGSAFKPFAYSQFFKSGASPETVLWDVKTEFNPNCTSTADQEENENGLDCYHPKNYDEKFRGPVSLREALAQSINVPSVKVLYLAGVKETIKLAKSMEISTLNEDLGFYGLALVLGGGEVKLIDMVSAYGVFAADGIKTEPSFILRIEDSEGNIIEENKKTPKRALESQVTRIINDVLSDNEARAPLFGSRSSLYIPGYQVAAKTGTTQQYKDAWTIGYTPNLVAGVWAGNNNSSSTDQKPGLVLAAPIWNSFMEKALEYFPNTEFKKADESAYVENLPLKETLDLEDPHSILYYLEEEPERDKQYPNWEKAIYYYLHPTSTDISDS